jgi:hypothetical protein
MTLRIYNDTELPMPGPRFFRSFFLRGDYVLNLRFSNFDLISRDTNYFTIAPDGNWNSVAAMFGDSLSHSLPKSFLSPIRQERK